MAAGGLFSTPRPEPGHLLPALGGAVLILAALPLFLLLGWPVSGWALAAVVTYALAYTFELGLSLTTYFGGEPR